MNVEIKQQTLTSSKTLKGKGKKKCLQSDQ